MELCAPPVACICWRRCLIMAVVFLSASAIAQTTITNMSQAAAPIGRPGCPTRCGNLTVPYPFGIGIGSQCAYDAGFEIFCDTASNPPRAILSGLPPILVDISEMQISILGAIVLANCYNPKGVLVRSSFPPSINYYPLPVRKINNHFSFSPDENKITTVGCDDTVTISSQTNEISRCTSRCSHASQVPDNGTCSGIGCCQLPLPKGSNNFYNISMVSAMNHTKVWPFNPCVHTFFGDTSKFRFLGASDLRNPNLYQRVLDSVPVVLDWAIGNLNCKEAQNSSGYACQANSHCVDSGLVLGGYRCSCDHGYEGK